jgi:hypothetical protein
MSELHELRNVLKGLELTCDEVQVDLEAYHHKKVTQSTPEAIQHHLDLCEDCSDKLDSIIWERISSGTVPLKVWQERTLPDEKLSQKTPFWKEAVKIGLLILGAVLLAALRYEPALPVACFLLGFFLVARGSSSPKYAVILILVFEFPSLLVSVLTPGPVSKGSGGWNILLLQIFAMFIGMAVHALWESATTSKKRGLNIRREIVTVCFAALTFLPISKIFTLGETGVEGPSIAHFIVVLLALESGFLWREFFRNDSNGTESTDTK